MRGGLQRSSEQDGGVDTRISGDTSLSTTLTTSGRRGAAPRGGRMSRERGVHGQREHKKPGVCRFYVMSTCKYGNRCKYYHPKPPATLTASGERGDINSEKRPPQSEEHSTRRAPSDLNLGMFMKPTVKSRVPVQRPEVGGSKTADDLLKVELEQLAVRFPGDQSKVIEKGKHGVVYRVTFTPTDPDWIFAFKTVDLLVNFPKDYPLNPLSVVVPEDQDIPKECISNLNSAIMDSPVTHRSSGSLMLRPFLHWLDRVITMLVMESLPEDQYDEVESAPEDDLAPVTQELSDIDTDGNDDDDDDDDEETGDVRVVEEHELEGDDLESNEGLSNVTRLTAAKRGTEIRLKDLVLGQYVGTAVFPNLKLVAECTRCKSKQDMIVTAEKCVSNVCSRCHACMSVTYHSALVHAGSVTLGYMDLLGCAAVDVVLMDTNVTVTCLECGRENTTKGFSYGQSKDVWCRRCHSKLTLYAEQCKFVQHQPRELDRGAGEVSRQTQPKLKKKEPILKLGTPLPENGTCEHYKKSCRWLRFPCCGKTYPCDVCHDSKEDHPMERANRMICGYCSQEQVYTTSKPCTHCGFGLAAVKHSAYWEGGQGCRNKVKMSRNDKHKFAQSSSKTTSKHLERVGVKGKKNQKQ